MKTLKNPLLLLIVFSTVSFAQEKATRSFTIKGKVKNEISISEDQLTKHTVQTIGTVNITNHKGELKGKAKDMSGVLLRDILQKVELDEDNPKYFSEYYFVCTGTDNYKVVFSWNELFNTSVAQRVFIVTQKDRKNMLDDEEGILMISADDFRTGRRYVKNLETIQVRRAE
ncbi:MAG TPA: hypothetical protein VGD40_07735 [Chryseosolibacter sp.]